MKKNKMMRVASALLIAVLLTTSAISGTFAKYVTSDSGSDAARVAKWGVTALVSGDLFGADYAAADDNGISATYTGSVDSSSDATGDKIVAPGTKNATGVKIAISGTPEVKNAIAFSSTTAENKDIVLKAGNYGTMVAAYGVTADNFGSGTYYTLSGSTYTKAATFSDAATYYEVHDTVNVTADYYPIIWSVKVNNDAATTKANVAAVVTALEALSTTNDSLTAIDKYIVITWEWAFTNNSVSYTDGADTILGNLAAADADAVVVKTSDSGDTYTTPTANTDYCLNVALNYSISVTQVD